MFYTWHMKTTKLYDEKMEILTVIRYISTYFFSERFSKIKFNKILL